MFEKYVITHHAIERYAERICYDKADVIRRIKKDLHFTKVKKIVNNGDIRHVFTFNGKEFIFKKDGDVWILRTVIKRNRSENSLAMQKRDYQKMSSVTI